MIIHSLSNTPDPSCSLRDIEHRQLSLLKSKIGGAENVSLLFHQFSFYKGSCFMNSKTL